MRLLYFIISQSGNNCIFLIVIIFTERDPHNKPSVAAVQESIASTHDLNAMFFVYSLELLLVRALILNSFFKKSIVFFFK